MTIHTSTVISNTKVKARWSEPYTSEAVNSFMGALSVGIHRGFRLEWIGTTIVQLTDDPIHADSMAIIRDTDTGRSFTYIEDTEVTFNLAAYAGTRVWIYVYVNYTISAATAVEYRVVDTAETANAWTNSAILLGSVRVPGAGNIDNGDIDTATAQIANLNTDWISVNHNSWFQQGGAGYFLSGTTSYAVLDLDEYIGTQALRLGDISGTGGSTTVSAELTLPTLEPEDLVYFRFKAKAATVANGGLLSVSVGTDFDETIIDANVATYDDYGFVVRITTDQVSPEVRLTCDLSAGASATGHFFIDQFEVWLHRPGAPVSSGPVILTGREVHVGRDEIEVAGLSANTGVLNIFDVNGSEPFSDSIETAHASPATSMLHADNIGIRAASVQDFMWPKAVFDGGVVSDSGTNTVDVTALKVRASTGSSGSRSRYFELGAVVDHALPTTAGIEEFFVAWDPSTLGITSFLTSAVGSNPNVVLLAYVRYTGTVIDRIIDIRDVLADLERGLPMTISGTDVAARFQTLEGALRVTAAAGFGGHKEFVLSGQTTIGGAGVLKPATIDLPTSCTLRGVAQALLVISTYGGAEETEVFNVPALGECVVEGLTFSPAALGAGVRLFSSTGTPDRVVFRDVRVLTSGGFRFDKCIDMEPDEELIIDNCSFAATTACVEVAQATSPNDLMVKISGCSFGGGSYTLDGRALDLSVDANGANNGGSVFVSDCRFMEADFGPRLVGRIQMSNVYSLVPIEIDSDNEGSSISGVNIDVEQYLATASAPSTFAFSFEDGLRATVSGVSINATGSGTSYDAAKIGAVADNDECAFSNIAVKHTDGNAFQMSGMASCTVSGIIADSVGADAGRLGIKIGLGADKCQINDVVLRGYVLDSAIDAASSTYCQWGFISVKQTGGSGFFGFLNAGTNPQIVAARIHEVV